MHARVSDEIKMHEMRLDVGLDAYEKSVSFDTDAYINDFIRPQVDGPDSLKVIRIASFKSN